MKEYFIGICKEAIETGQRPDECDDYSFWYDLLELLQGGDGDAEMVITHKDGSTEYINNIDSIGLLAHKDYEITYYGEIRRKVARSDEANDP